jgi:transcription elongation GreA/GreB family factor
MLRSTPAAPASLPMTSAAWSALRAEAVRSDRGPTERVDADLARRIRTIRDVLQSVELIDDPRLAVVGRRVTYVEDDGERLAVSLVIPGDGDPRHGWISVDSPLGEALLGSHAGERVVVHAPAGDRHVDVVEVA